MLENPHRGSACTLKRLFCIPYRAMPIRGSKPTDLRPVARLKIALAGLTTRDLSAAEHRNPGASYSGREVRCRYCRVRDGIHTSGRIRIGL